MGERFGARLVGGLALVADPSRGIGHRRLDQLDAGPVSPCAGNPLCQRDLEKSG